MWEAIGNFFLSPILGKALDAYKARLAAGNTEDQIAATLAARELQVQRDENLAQAQLKRAEIGHFWEPEKLFAYIMVIYFAKIIVFDKVFGLGVTDPIEGQAAQWAGMIMTFYLGKRGIENVARIITRK